MATGVLVILGTHGRRQPAPEEIVVGSRPSCSSCSIDVERVATLGGATEADGLICLDRRLGNLHFDRSSDGRWFVGPACDRYRTLVFGASGDLVGSVGEDGEGPGELRLVTSLWVDERDRLKIVDHDRRVLVFDSRLRFVDSYRNPGAPLGVVGSRAGGSFQNMVLADPRSRDEVTVLHRVSGDGRLSSSFAVVLYTRDLIAQRNLAEAVAGLWSAPLTRPELRLWSPDGTLLKHLTRDADWFPGRRAEDVARDDPLLASIDEDGEGRLWTLTGVPDRAPSRRSTPGPSGRHARRDSVVEVIDVATGRLLVSTRFDLLFTRLVDGFLLAPVDDEEGNTTYEVWSTEIVDTAEQDRAPASTAPGGAPASGDSFMAVRRSRARSRRRGR